MVNINKILEYLTDLQNNNNREWYHAHANERKEAMQEFEKLVGIIMERIRIFDDTIPFYNPKDLTFKLVRDTRFSHDKSPYNPVFRAHIGPRGKLPIPVGYYIYLKPNNETFLGGGLFADMFSNAVTMVRDYIVDHSDELEKIINNETFSKDFTVMGTKLKKVPRGYDVNHPMAEYIKHKSWYLEYWIKDEEMFDSETFIELAVEKFKTMKDFNQYLNKSLIDFKMPER